MNLFYKTLDCVFLVRPMLLLPAWIFYLAGLWSAGRHSVQTPGHPAPAVWTGLGLTAVMGAVYILNQIQDVETDRLNRKLFLISEGHVPVRRAWLEAGLLLFAGLFLGFQTGLRAGVLLLSLFLLTGWAYSFPPARFKDRPVASLIVNGAGGLVIASLGWAAGGGPGWVPLRSAVYFFACASVSFNTMLPDMRGDRASGKITFAVRYGLRRTVFWALVFECATVILAWAFREWILFYPALVMLPFFIYALSRKTVDEVIRATKYSVVAMAAAVCAAYPWFPIPVSAVFFGSRFYYKARFGLEYPSLKSS